MTAPAATAAGPALTDDLKMPLWWIPVVVGVLGIIFGFLALAWPGPTLLAIGLIFGIYLLMAGFGDLMAAFSHETSSAFVRVLYGLLGILTVGVGFVLIVRPAASVFLAAFALGVWFLISGCLQLAQGIAVRESRVWNLIIGLIGVVAGGMIVAQPGIGVVTLVYIVSLSLILRGIASIVLGFGLKAADKLISEGAA